MPDVDCISSLCRRLQPRQPGVLGKHRSFHPGRLEEHEAARLRGSQLPSWYNLRCHVWRDPVPRLRVQPSRQLRWPVLVSALD
jgi:hypothetical protein